MHILWIPFRVLAMALAEPQEPEFPPFHMGDVLLKARLHPRDRKPIKSAEEMAKLLTVELGREVSRSSVNAWESGRNQPGRNGIRLEDVVVAYARVTGWSASKLWDAATKGRCFTSSVQVSPVATLLGEMHLFDPDDPIIEERSLALVVTE